ncbi:PREDICTED: zinc finger protein 280A [Propithecus coquereli]|uniref:zinc finger protein 280A n=1 Tax=Propithecus coquereli TaxID=379532 RepID=UPI00063F830B|nr:PREDICTED: zinc finger protein 280A [Propithecus coquereli]
MADLFSCEEEQEPQPLKKNVRESKQRDKAEEDDDLIFVGVEHVNKDPEILFVRMISNPKPIISNILNRVTPGSKRKRSHLRQDPVQESQPANHTAPTAQAVAPVSQSEWRSTDGPVTIESSPNPGCEMSSPQVLPDNSSALLSPRIQRLVGAVLSAGGRDVSPCDSKQLSTSDINSRNPQRAKFRDGIPGVHSLAVVPSGLPPIMPSTPSQVACSTSSCVPNGASFPWADDNKKSHINLMDGANGSEGLVITDFSTLASQNQTLDPEKGNLIMLLSDFYYGQHKGDGTPEQKTHTIFKCHSCLKVLKNVKFMNHVKHHLELERQRSDSWENHTTCQHCHRQFPTPFQLQCHIESVHTTQEPAAVCKICELSFETDQVLLQHMKDNHKPGEMPYVCQICNYRSSAFADVEAHFRTCHENTKTLLCLFCFKIFKTATGYINHCWRHWNEKVFRCPKCRLQFLTLKEEIEHRSKNHQTFKKPEQMQGLPPATKVIIQTSVRSVSRDAASITVSNTDLGLSPVT